MTQHNYAAGNNPFLFDGLHNFPGIVKADGRAGEMRLLHAGNLENDALRSQISEAHLHVGEFLEALLRRNNQVLAFGWRWSIP